MDKCYRHNRAGFHCPDCIIERMYGLCIRPISEILFGGRLNLWIGD